MKVSIITIAYNSEETIEDTIKSVVNQDYPDIEYIIIDGKSTDRTLEIVEKYKSGISIVVSESDQGIYDAMNKGVLKATGEIVGILNSDDLYASNDVISNVVRNIEDAECLYSDLVYVDRSNTDEVTRYWKSGEYKKGMFKKGWMPPHPTFFVRKTCYNKYGHYSLALKSSADYELMLRFIHKNEISVKYMPLTTIKMRVGGQSNVSVKNRLAANKEDRMAWSMNGLSPGTATIRKPLSKLTQFLKKDKQ
ncbi:MAG: glycosyltransferase involved in cell wall biosynthesis [Parvicellaceae bacterium]|jgi:glycosyltransferase involved in cell wall biosynthesis